MKKKISFAMVGMLVVITLLFLINAAHAELFETFPKDVCGGNLGTFMSGWAVLCYLAILVSIGILTLIFLVSRALGIQKGEVWAKFEMAQVAVTVLILIVIVGFTEFIMCSDAFTPNSLFGAGGDNSMIVSAENYLKDLSGYNFISFNIIIFGNIVREALGNLELKGELFGIEIMFKPLDGLNIWDFPFDIAQAALITIMITTATQIMLFAYVKEAMFGVFLPIGILLRCYEPFRKIGGALIGITIALGLFWPLMLVVNDIALEGIGVDDLLINTLITMNEQFERYNPFDLLKNPLDPAKGFIQITVPTLTNPFGISLNHTPLLSPLYKFWSALQSLLWNILAINVLGSLFLPLINFAVIATAMRELSRLFGEQADISNLTRMI